MKTSSVVAAALLVLAPVCGFPGDAGGECFRKEVEAHVREQFALYGPLSEQREYFGFVYRRDGRIESAVTRSGKCPDGNCLIETSDAAALIPRASKVLGEWHTHPHAGSTSLSSEDVRGARNNQHIRCYAAYYSKPNGEIYSWEPRSTSVPSAMASRVTIGNYANNDYANVEELAAQIDEKPKREM